MRLAPAITLVILLAAPAAHAGSDAAGAVRQAGEQFLRAHARGFGTEVRVAVEAPDPRLRLAHCPQPLQAELAAGVRPVGQTTVVVRCPGASPWAVTLAAQVQVFGEVLVTTRALVRGAALTADDFTRRRDDLTRAAPGVITDPAQALGQKLRYPLAPGAVLNAGMLEAAPVVRRGQAVTIVSGTGGFEVRAQGEALADGGPGQLVRVRNPQTRRVMEGRVESAGLVRVNL